MNSRNRYPAKHTQHSQLCIRLEPRFIFGSIPDRYTSDTKNMGDDSDTAEPSDDEVFSRSDQARPGVVGWIRRGPFPPMQSVVRLLPASTPPRRERA